MLLPLHYTTTCICITGLSKALIKISLTTLYTAVKVNIAQVTAVQRDCYLVVDVAERSNKKTVYKQLLIVS